MIHNEYTMDTQWIGYTMDTNIESTSTQLSDS